jgi:hypothetical protein
MRDGISTGKSLETQEKVIKYHKIFTNAVPQANYNTPW